MLKPNSKNFWGEQQLSREFTDIVFIHVLLLHKEALEVEPLVLAELCLLVSRIVRRLGVIILRLHCSLLAQPARDLLPVPVVLEPAVQDLVGEAEADRQVPVLVLVWVRVGREPVPKPDYLRLAKLGPSSLVKLNRTVKFS